MSSEKLSPERAVRLLRAKVGELENYVKDEMTGLRPENAWLAADIALIAQLLADHIEANQTVRITGPEASGTKYSQCGPECSEGHTYADGCALFVPHVQGYLNSILNVTEFDVGSKEEADYVAALKAECDAYLAGRRPYWGPLSPGYDEMGQ